MEIFDYEQSGAELSRSSLKTGTFDQRKEFSKVKVATFDLDLMSEDKVKAIQGLIDKGRSNEDEEPIKTATNRRRKRIRIKGVNFDSEDDLDDLDESRETSKRPKKVEKTVEQSKKKKIQKKILNI